MLSGVGDASRFERIGIDPRHHLPGVGKNIHHIDVMLVQACIRPVSYGITWRTVLRGGVDLLRYLMAGRGMFTTNGAEGCGVTRSSPERSLA